MQMLPQVLPDFSRGWTQVAAKRAAGEVDRRERPSLSGVLVYYFQSSNSVPRYGKPFRLQRGSCPTSPLLAAPAHPCPSREILTPRGLWGCPHRAAPQAQPVPPSWDLTHLKLLFSTAFSEGILYKGQLGAHLLTPCFWPCPSEMAAQASCAHSKRQGGGVLAHAN